MGGGILKRDRIFGVSLGVTALVACPCVLPLVLALLGGVLGGTAAGAFLAANMPWLFAGATAYFVLSVGAMAYLLSRRRKADACPLPPDAVHRRLTSGRASKGDIAGDGVTVP